MNLIKEHKTFSGKTSFWSHESIKTNSKMGFATFIPEGKPIKGCIIWLSGLTCDSTNFITKAGAQKYLQDSGMMVICPDTSPRGLDLKGEHETYDFGSGAGFYVNSLTEGYKNHYNMFDYVAFELHDLITSEFGVSTNNISIAGHSMGGHGALILGLTFPDKFRSISAFAPITNPLKVSWGQRAFEGYLGGENQELWKKYDACELVASGKKHPCEILIDQGDADEFLNTSLLPQNFIDVCEKSNQSLKVNFRKNYDHSYYFIASFIESHIKFHSEGL
ncbi:MAG: S-formylglutathione hydrolase [Rickettsiales bacterium]|jgi:S-formylglutathione hydrolase